jgi:hypothetical protein
MFCSAVRQLSSAQKEPPSRSWKKVEVEESVGDKLVGVCAIEEIEDQRGIGNVDRVAWLENQDRLRKLVVTTSRAKRSADFIAHLQVLDRLYCPKPSAPMPPVVLVLDNGPIRVSKPTLAALAKRAHWLTIEWLHKYAPELNGIDVVWGDL